MCGYWGFALLLLWALLAQSVYAPTQENLFAMKGGNFILYQVIDPNMANELFRASDKMGNNQPNCLNIPRC
jgi:hypothetical protein